MSLFTHFSSFTPLTLSRSLSIFLSLSLSLSLYRNHFLSRVKTQLFSCSYPPQIIHLSSPIPPLSALCTSSTEEYANTLRFCGDYTQLYTYSLKRSTTGHVDQLQVMQNYGQLDNISNNMYTLLLIAIRYIRYKSISYVSN